MNAVDNCLRLKKKKKKRKWKTLLRIQTAIENSLPKI